MAIQRCKPLEASPTIVAGAMALNERNAMPSDFLE